MNFRFSLFIALFLIAAVKSFGGIDLSITNLQLNSTLVEVGNTLSVNFTLSNTGNIASNSSYTGMYLSSDATWDSNDVYLTSKFNQTTAFGSSEIITNQIVSIPQNISAGIYFLIFKADYDNDQEEDNENNNTNFLELSIVPGSARDLAISISSSAITVEQGNPLSVSFSLSNLQVGDIGPNSTGVYLSSNTSYEATDISIATDIYSGGIGGNSQIVLAGTAQVPFSTPPGNYYLLLKADTYNEILETNETNNVASLSVTIVASSNNRDLTINNLNAPSSAERNAYINITGDLANIGSSAANSSYVGYYLSSNNTLESGDVLLGNLYTYTISGNSTESIYKQVKIPESTIVGNYFLLCVADYTGLISELIETNNVAAKAITITAPSKDLTVVSASPTVSGAEAGNQIQVNYTLKNIGTGSIGMTYSSISISNDNVLSNDDIQIEYNADFIPAAGINYAFSSSAILPYNLPSGNYFLIIKTDYVNYVNEAIETNNTSAVAFTINAYTNQTDLSISGFSTFTSIEAGGLLNGWFSLINAGTSPIKTSTYSKLFVSTDATWDNLDTEIETFEQSPFYSNQTQYTSFYYKTSSTMAPGNYYLIALADAENVVNETNESNNMLATLFEVIAPEDRNLTIESETISNNTIEAGSIVTLDYILKNIGEVEASGSYTEIYISSDGIVDETDIPINFLYEAPLLGGNFISNTNLELYIPQDIPAGNYHLLIAADAFDEVIESDEANNIADIAISITAPDIDMTISSISLSKTTANANEKIKINFTANNSGGTYCSYTSCSIYLSQDPSLNAQDILLNNSLYIPEILPGSSYDFVDEPVTIPVGTTSGTYYLLIKADPDHYIFESDETNNINYISISIIGLPTPDLTIRNASASTAQIAIESGLLIKYNNVNVGNLETNSGFNITGIYLSDDTQLDGNDEVLDEILEYSYVAAGDSNFMEYPIYIPSEYLGSYYILIKADHSGYITESNENNNIAYIPIEILPSGAIDLQFHSLTSEYESVAAGNYVSVTYQLKNTGNQSANTVINRIYLSTDATLDGSDIALSDWETYSVLAGATGYEDYVEFLISAGTPVGNYYLIAQTDPDNEISEISDVNNLSILPIEIIADGLMDVKIVNAVTSSPIAVQGANVTLSFAIKNSGSAVVTTENTMIYWSMDAILGNDDVLLDTYSSTNTLFVSESEMVNNFPITLPSVLNNGLYYILIVADHENLINEYNENNNVGLVQIEIDNTLSNQNAFESVQYSIYPNPTSEYIYIKLNNELVSQNEVLIITNSTGEIMNQTKATNLLQMNISAYPSGTYYVHLKNKNNSGYQFVVLH